MLSFVRNFPMIGIWLCVLGGLFCLMLKARAARLLSLSVCGVQVVLSAVLLAHTLHTKESFDYPMGHFPSPFGNELRAGPLEALIALCISVVMLLSLMGGTDDLKLDIPENKLNSYYILTDLLFAALLVIVYTNDIFTSYVFIEIITIGACVIIAIKPGGKALVASMWYLIMSLVGGGLLLFSIAMLYGVTGHLLMPGLFEAVAALTATEQYILPLFILTGLMCVGLGIKCALFPFHSWLPGAYTNATTASSSILAGLVGKGYIFLIIKIFVRVYGVRAMELLHITDILLILGTLGLLFGSIQATRQKNIKGMLAYSSVAQVGYIFIGIGLNNLAGLAAACFQIVAHAVCKAMLFTSAGGLAASSGHKKDWNSLRGAGRRDIAAGVAFTCGALSMVGIPLFPGFVAKIYLASASSGTPFVGIALVAVLVVGTLLNAVYYLPAVLCIYAKPVEGDSFPAAKKSMAGRVALWAFVAVCMGLGLFSQPVMSAIETGLALFGM